MAEVSRQLMRMFAVGLDLDIDFFDDKIDQHISMFRVAQLPDQPERPLPGQLRAGAHTDYGSLTIVRPGGQARAACRCCTKAGQWVDVPVDPRRARRQHRRPDGEWTNDRWVSTLHRVVNPPRDRRHDAGASRWCSSTSPTTTR